MRRLAVVSIGYYYIIVLILTSNFVKIITSHNLTFDRRTTTTTTNDPVAIVDFDLITQPGITMEPTTTHPPWRKSKKNSMKKYEKIVLIFFQ